MADLTKPALRVNGIPVRCSAAGGGPTVLWDPVAETTDRNVYGSIVRTRRGWKRSVSAKTSPMAWDDAANVADLVEGRGAAVTYDTASPFLVNNWAPGVITNAGISRGSGSPNSVSYYQGGFLLNNTTGYITFAGLGGLLSGARGVTINTWVRIPTGSTGWAVTYVKLAKAGAGDTGIRLAHDATTGLELHYASTHSLLSGAIANWANDFHMLTGVIRDTVVSGYPAMSLYFDGVLLASAALPAQAFLYPDRDTLVQGPSTSTAATRIDETVVYPFPINDDQVAGLYAAMTRNATSSTAPTSTTPWAVHQAMGLPRVLVSGDGVSDPFYAIGKVVGAASLAAYRDPVSEALVNNSRTLDLQFIEV